MAFFDKISGWQAKFFLWVGLPVIAAIGFTFGMFDLVPAWQAKAGSGIEGTFTAVREDCGRRSCTWHGDWAATDGGEQRTDVILYDEPDGVTAGAQVAARDTGARNGVFANEGGSTWLLMTAFVVGGLVAAVFWILFLIRTFRRRRTAEPAPTT